MSKFGIQGSGDVKGGPPPLAIYDCMNGYGTRSYLMKNANFMFLESSGIGKTFKNLEFLPYR